MDLKIGGFISSGTYIPVKQINKKKHGFIFYNEHKIFHCFEFFLSFSFFNLFIKKGEFYFYFFFNLNNYEKKNFKLKLIFNTNVNSILNINKLITLAQTITKKEKQINISQQ